MGLYIILAIIGLVISIALSVKFAGCAEDKGYSFKSYFWVCFLLGTIGYILVAALPDLTIQYALANLEHSLSSPSSASNNTASLHSGSVSTKSSIIDGETWVCGYCHTSNKMNYGQCKKCGKYRG